MIAEQSIPLVVVAISHHYGPIRERITAMYPGVRVMDIVELLDEGMEG